MPREYSSAIVIDLPPRELLLATRPLTLFAELKYNEEGHVFDVFMDMHDNSAITAIMQDHLCLGRCLRDLPIYNADKYLFTLTLDWRELYHDVDVCHYTRYIANHLAVDVDSLLPLFNFPDSAEGRLCEISQALRARRLPPQDSGYVIIVPGFNEYAWPTKKWQEFIQWFCKRSKLPVILPANLLTKREVDAFGEYCILKHMESIWELAWFASSARAVFTVESWFAHFVATLDVPLLILGLRKDIRGFQYQHHAIQYAIGPPVHLRSEDVLSKAVKVSQIYDLMR